MNARLVLSWLAATSVAVLGTLAACSSAAPPTNQLAHHEDAGDDGSPSPSDSGSSGTPPPPPSEAGSGPGRVYANTDDTLFLFEPVSGKVTSIGKFSCLDDGEEVIDLAVDRTGDMYATTFTRFLKVDPFTAKCSAIATAPGIAFYPNSLSFVPAGTVDPTKEALVGYAALDLYANQYVRIDTTTGEMTTIGDLNPPAASTLYEASGDLISLIEAGNKSYLTIKPENPDGGDPTDLFAEIDPSTGEIKHILGNTHQTHIFGLGYWAGKGYGFSDDGHVTQIDMTTGAGMLLQTMMLDGGAASWFGAGVTTEAPVQ